MINQRTRRFLVAALVSGVVVAAGLANAATQIRSMPARCKRSLNGGSPTVSPETGQVVNFDVNAQAVVFCPVEKLSQNPVITSVTLNVWKNSTSGIRAKVCVTFVGGGGGHCGQVDSDGQQGVRPISPSTSQWSSNPNDYRYISVTMSNCINSGSNCNALFGMSQSN